MNILKTFDVPKKDCRGKSYDAANTAGKCFGFQATIKDKCEFAIFGPSTAHSLNLVGILAVGCFSEASLQLIQTLLNFFSGSLINGNFETMFRCRKSFEALL